MSENERLNFLVYYRRQLDLIIGKLDRQIEKMQDTQASSKKDLSEIEKDLTDPEFIKRFVKYEGLIDTFDETRQFLMPISDEEEQRQGNLYYSSSRHGKNFAMIVLSCSHMNVYFAPRLGIYDSIPQEVQVELKFGKSQGDRWDKFQLTSTRQLRIALSFLKPHLVSQPVDAAREQKAG
jgi:hypothetical protein